MIDTRKIKKLLILNIPYVILGLVATNIGEAWRMAEGADSSAKLLSLFSTLPVAFGNPLPSFYPLDLIIGILCGAGLRLAVYLRGKMQKSIDTMLSMALPDGELPKILNHLWLRHLRITLFSQRQSD